MNTAETMKLCPKSEQAYRAITLDSPASISPTSTTTAYVPRAKRFVLATLRKSFEEFYCMPPEAAHGLNIESSWRFISGFEFHERLTKTFGHLKQIERERAPEWKPIEERVYQRAISEDWPEKKYDEALRLAKVEWLTGMLSAEELTLWRKTVEEMQTTRAYDKHHFVKWLMRAWRRQGRSREEWIRFLRWREGFIRCYREQLIFDLDSSEKRSWRRWMERKAELHIESECWATLWQHASHRLVAYLKRRFRCETPGAYPHFCNWINTRRQLNRRGYKPQNIFKRHKWHIWVIAKLDLLVNPDTPLEWQKRSLKEAKYYYTRSSPQTILRMLRGCERALEPQLLR